MFKSSQKRRLYPTVLCYHGGAASREESLPFRSTLGDLRAQVTKQLMAGYEFVLPKDYLAYLEGTKTFEKPVCCIHFDDCLDTLNMLIPWLIEHEIPCGIAVISRRLGKYDPEQGYSRWTQVYEWVQTGFVELMSHTHNLHNLTLVATEDGTIDAAPVLEGPCWIDDGDVLYRPPGDPRWYWDFSHVDKITLGLPLFGTDPWDGATPVVTTMTLTPKETGSVSVLRLWMSLSKPSGSGYDAEVEITADGVVVWDGVIKPKQYETRAQWVEREFYSINLDSSFEVTAGVPFELVFRTKNVGKGVALISTLATSDDDAFRAVTNCRGLYPEGSQGPPERYWQYIDYPANSRWPGIPCMILGFGTGRMATVAEYQGYIGDDCQSLSSAFDNWLGAEWEESLGWEAPWVEWDAGDQWDYYGEYYGIMYLQEKIPLGWNNPNKVTAVVPLVSAETVTVEFLRFYTDPAEYFIGGDADPYRLDVTPASMDEAMNRSYPATFRFEIGDTETGPWTYVGDGAVWRMARGAAIDLDAFVLTAGITRYVRITPINGGPTVGTEQTTRWPIRSVFVGYRAAVNPVVQPDQLVYPFGAYYVGGYGEVQQKEFKDIGNDLKQVLLANGLRSGYTIQAYRNVPFAEFREPDLRLSPWALGRWLIYGDRALNVSVNNMLAYNGNMLPDVPHRGVAWQVSLEPDRDGNATVKHRPDTLDHVAFDAWFFNKYGGIDYGVLNDGGVYNDVSHVVGTFAPGDIIVEDESGATAEVVWYSGAEVMQVTNVQGTWLGGYRTVTGPNGTAHGSGDGCVTYADDKGWLQARGVKCTLIISNYSFEEGDISKTVASYVVNNPEIYVPQIVQIAVDDGWDGITCNIEGAPVEDRDRATEFYKQLGRALHAAGKLLHITAPAITGTDYDAVDYWTGWCDQAELIKYVDMLKVMSYTESGYPWSPPRPAAPQWFWDAVYKWVRENIPVRYWPRILCGGRMFGHVWGPDSGGYTTYHRGIADCLTHGARLDIVDTEFGWSGGGKSCWFGTPLTVDRSQKEAETSGFGGIGIWKIDDGDIEEFVPLHRTLGRYEEMTYIDTRFPPEISWGSSGGPNFNTVVNSAQNGEENRLSLWVMPLHEYDVSLRIQTQSEYEAVRNLFMVARGSARSFRFKDWADYTMTDTVIGLGDGSQTNFQVVKSYAAGGEVLVRNITKLVVGTVSVAVDGVPASPDIDHNTGIISFMTAPALGAEVTVTCEFDVHVRFKEDSFPAEIIEWGDDGAFLSPGTVALKEVRRA